jgi:TolB-like protein
VPEGVAAALHRALAKNPADRFRTTRELGAALEGPLQTPSGGTAATRRPGPSVRKMALFGSTILVAVVGAWAAWSTFGSGGSGPEGDRPLLAVLPFENLSPDPDDAYFADGIQEEITSSLSGLSGLRVISRSSVMQYRDQRPPARQIADELGVQFIVEGSARIAGDQVRLTAQLIDARRDQHLWNQSYDRELSADRLFDLRERNPPRRATSGSGRGS